MTQVVVAFGGNLGDVPQTFRRAISLLESEVALGSITTSRLYRSTPVGAVAGDVFWNAAVEFETDLSPLVLLGWLQTIESSLGRTREVHWGPRTLDLDLIFYGDDIVRERRLTVPHPQAWLRKFVLAPANDLRPDRQHPELKVSIKELLERIDVRPLPVRYCGSASRQSELQAAAAEFPEVALQFVDAVVDLTNESGLGIVEANQSPTNELEAQRPPRFWIVNDSPDPVQFLKDVLRASAGSVWPVDWPQ